MGYAGLVPRPSKNFHINKENKIEETLGGRQGDAQTPASVRLADVDANVRSKPPVHARTVQRLQEWTGITDGAVDVVTKGTYV